MNKEELVEVRGGIQVLSSTAINAIVRAFETIYDLGRALGSAIRRATSKSKRC